MAFANPNDRYNRCIIPKDPSHGLATWVWLDNMYIRPHWSLEFYDDEFIFKPVSKCTRHTVDDLIDHIRMEHANIILEELTDVID